MHRITIAPNLYQYQFAPEPGKYYGINIFALVDGESALLIDTGYPNLATAVKEDLDRLGCTPTHVIISHFHTDHMLGLRSLPGLTVYGSYAYTASLDMSKPKEKLAPLMPTDLLNEDTGLTFGNFQLHLLVMPGHAADNVYTIINETYMHVGDDILFTNDGRAILPFVELERVNEHIASLEKLKEYQDYVFLLGHGHPLKTPSAILNTIDNRLKYLRAVANSDKPLTYEEATKDCTGDFLHKEWHTGLYK